MEMQNPPKPDLGQNPKSENQPSRSQIMTAFRGQSPSPNPGFPARGSYHRRAQSEVQFRIPDDLDLLSDPFDGPSASFEELGSEDDLFCTYMDIEKFGSKLEDGPGAPPKPDNAGGSVWTESGDGGGDGEKNERPRHRHSNSVDGSSILDTIEAKKAMAPDKLAELWTIDPKRAKRYECM